MKAWDGYIQGSDAGNAHSTAYRNITNYNVVDANANAIETAEEDAVGEGELQQQGEGGRNGTNGDHEEGYEPTGITSKAPKALDSAEEEESEEGRREAKESLMEETEEEECDDPRDLDYSNWAYGFGGRLGERRE